MCPTSDERRALSATINIVGRPISSFRFGTRAASWRWGYFWGYIFMKKTTKPYQATNRKNSSSDAAPPEHRFKLDSKPAISLLFAGFLLAADKTAGPLIERAFSLASTKTMQIKGINASANRLFRAHVSTPHPARNQHQNQEPTSCARPSSASPR